MKYIFELWGGLMVVDSVMRMVLRWFCFFVWFNSFPSQKKHQKYMYGNQVILNIVRQFNVSECKIWKMWMMCVISYVCSPYLLQPLFLKSLFLGWWNMNFSIFRYLVHFKSLIFIYIVNWTLLLLPGPFCWEFN